MATHAFCWRLIFNMNLSIYNVIRDEGTTNLYYVKFDGPYSFQVVIWLERQHWRSMTLIFSSLKPAWSSALCRWTTHTLSLLSVWRWLKRLSNITIIDYFTWTSNINFHWVTCCHSTGWEPLGSSTRAATRLPATWAFMIRSSTKAILTNSLIALIFRLSFMFCLSSQILITNQTKPVKTLSGPQPCSGSINVLFCFNNQLAIK